MIIPLAKQECNISAGISKEKDASESGKKMEALPTSEEKRTKISYFGAKSPIWINYQSLEKIFVASLRFSLNRTQERTSKNPKADHSFQLQMCPDLRV
jgi:hypothetical protein